MRKFVPYFTLLIPVKGRFFLAILFGAISGLCSGYALPKILDEILPVIFQDTPDSDWVLLGVVSLIPLVFLVRGLSGFLNTYFINYCGLRVLEDIRMKLFYKIQNFSLIAFQEKRSGDLYSRILSDTHELQTAVTNIAKDLFKQPITLIGGLYFLISKSIEQKEVMFILFCLAVIPICVLPIRYFGRKLVKKALQMQEESANLSQVVQENLQGAKDIRSFSLEQREMNRFTLSVRSFFRHQLKVIKYSHAMSPSIEVISVFGVAASIFYATKSGITLEGLMPIVTALFMTYEPIKKLGAINGHLKRGEASLNRIEEVLHIQDPVKEPECPLSWGNAQGKIEFQDVYFQYSETPILKNLNLTINAGEVIAIVGPSGAGKSTMAQIVPKFYTPQQGKVLLDGLDITDLTKDNIRENIAIVSQDPFLFNDTIEANVLLGKKNATHDEVLSACQKAFAHEFIEQLENGYDTMAGDRGASLSGGQKQRIAIARAFLKDAPILILDEATSALDSESEMKIQVALNELVKGKTVIIIAHRFSTIQMANRIVVMNEGEIVGNGKHKELMEDCETYRTLYEIQNA